MLPNSSFSQLLPSLHEALNNCPRTAAILSTLQALYAPLATPSLDHPRVNHAVWTRCLNAIAAFTTNVHTALAAAPRARPSSLHRCHQDGRALLRALDSVGFYSAFSPSLPRSFLLDHILQFMPLATPDASHAQNYTIKMRYAHLLLRSPFTIYTALSALVAQQASDNLDFAACVSAAINVAVPPAHIWTHPVDGAAGYTEVLAQSGHFLQRLHAVNASSNTVKKVMVFLTTLLGLWDFPMEALYTPAGARLELPTFGSSHVPRAPIDVQAVREFRHMRQNSLVWRSRVSLILIPVKPVHAKLFPVFAHCALLLRCLEHSNLLTLHGINWPLPKPERSDPTTWTGSLPRISRDGSARNAFIVIERTACDLFEGLTAQVLRPIHIRLRILIDVLRGLQALHLTGLHHPALTPAYVRVNVAPATGFTGNAKLDQTCIIHNALFADVGNLVPIRHAVFLPPETITQPTGRPHLLSNMWSFAVIGCYLLAGSDGLSSVPPLQQDGHRSTVVAWMERIPILQVRNILRPCFNINPNDRPTTAHLLGPLENVLSSVSTQLSTRARQGQPAASSSPVNRGAPTVVCNVTTAERTATAAAAAADAAAVFSRPVPTATVVVSPPPQQPPVPTLPAPNRHSRGPTPTNHLSTAPSPATQRSSQLQAVTTSLPTPVQTPQTPTLVLPVQDPASPVMPNANRRALPIAVPALENAPHTASHVPGEATQPVTLAPTPTPTQASQPVVRLDVKPVSPSNGRDAHAAADAPAPTLARNDHPPGASKTCKPADFQQTHPLDTQMASSPSKPDSAFAKKSGRTPDDRERQNADGGEVGVPLKKELLPVVSGTADATFNNDDLDNPGDQNGTSGAKGQTTSAKIFAEADSFGRAKKDRENDAQSQPPILASKPKPLPSVAVSEEMLNDLLGDLGRSPPNKKPGTDPSHSGPPAESLHVASDPEDKAQPLKTSKTDVRNEETPSLQVTKPQISAALGNSQAERNVSVPLSLPDLSNSVRKRARPPSPASSSGSSVVVKQRLKKRRQMREAQSSAKDGSLSDSSSGSSYNIESRAKTKRTEHRGVDDSSSEFELDQVEEMMRLHSAERRQRKSSRSAKGKDESARISKHARRSSMRSKNYKEESSLDEINSVQSDSDGSLERPFRNLAPQPEASRREEADDSCLPNHVASETPSKRTTNRGNAALNEEGGPEDRRLSSRIKKKALRAPDEPDFPKNSSQSVPKQSTKATFVPEDEVEKANDGYTYSPEDEAHRELLSYKDTLIQKHGSADVLFRISSQASLKGDLNGSVDLGICFITGVGVAMNKKQGVTILKNAALYETTRAMYFYALCLEDGVGTAINEVEALRLYEKARKKENHINSIYRIALMTRSGRGTKRSFSDAARLFEIGAERGHVPSKVKLANCYAKHGQGVRRNMRKAVKLYEEAEKEESAEAILKLGLLYEDGESVRRNPSKALTRYKKAACLGYAPAETALGQCYRWGYGVEEDLDKAIDYYRRAAEKNHDLAIYELGQMYRAGVVFEMNNEKAVELYRKAMATKLPVAIVAYGEMLYYGRGVERDFDEAFKCFQEAANFGAEEGHRWLGDCYVDGTGVEKDEQKGFKCFNKAIELGSGVAHASIGQLYERGVGVKPSLTKALYHYQQGAKVNDPTALMNLGIFHEQGKHVKQNSQMAVEFYNKAIDCGSKEALCHLGDCYAGGRGVEKNLEEAVEFYRKGAGHEMSDAQFELGRCYYFGLGIEQDHAKAVELFETASGSGESEACRFLGTAYYDGRGVPQDYKQAVKHYEQAANEGNADAMVDLGRCYRDGKGVVHDLVKAAKLFEKAAEHPHENKVAMMEIGNMYHEGLGVTQNYETAVKWLTGGCGDGETAVSS